MATVGGLFDTVQSIHAGKDTWRLKVRVMRMWNMCSMDQPLNPFAIQMVLVDTEGSTIEATIRKPLMKKFSNVIHEGEAYKMSCFSVISNSGSYKATRHEFKLLFNFKTKVISFESALIPQISLTLTNSEEILATQGHSDNLLDVMGVLTRVFAEKTFEKAGRKTRVISLELQDDKGVIKLTLFGDFVEQVTEYINVGCHELPIVVLQFGKVKTFKGEIGVQNVFNASKLLWNPQIPQAIKFRNELAVHGIEDDVEIGFFEGTNSTPTLYDDFLKSFPRKTVGNLQDCEEDDIFIIMATVVRVLKDQVWWYMACSCHKGVACEGGLFYCPGCCTNVFDVTPRYKVKLEVSDGGEDTVNLLMFDSDCNALLKKSCKELLKETKKSIAGEYPLLFDTLNGMELLFKVEKTADHAFGYEDSFRVKRICYDVKIQKQFKCANSIQIPEKSKFKPPSSDLIDMTEEDFELGENSNPNINFTINEKLKTTTPLSTVSGQKTSKVEVTSSNVTFGSVEKDKCSLTLADDNDEVLISAFKVKKKLQPISDSVDKCPKKAKMKSVKLEAN